VGGGLGLVIVAALLIVTRVLTHGTGTLGSGAAGATATYGVATTASHCPAASVSKEARCPASPECWDGVNIDAGVVTVNPLPCDKPHTWQTFAIGVLPSTVSTPNVSVVNDNPTVRAVCSYPVLLRSRNVRGLFDSTAHWIIQVAPPDEAAYDSGTRTYRCLAAPGGYGAARTSLFGA
jgi:hypothetical protein